MAYYSLKKKNYTTLSNFLIILGVLLIILTYGPIIRGEIWFYIKEIRAQQIVLTSSIDNSNKVAVSDSIFAKFLSPKPILIEPVNRDFSLIIERIGVNAPVVKDVSIMNEDSYNDALKYGVAHAISSGYPSQNPGNTYIFAHASIDFWKLGKYATVFNLLRKLNLGDTVHVFYDNKDYIYEVVNKEVYPGWNTYPITRSVVEPILTLQTCDPPGTTINRLVVTAKLKQIN